MVAKFELRFKRRSSDLAGARISYEVSTAEDLDDARARGRALRQQAEATMIVGVVTLVKCSELEQF